MDMLQAMNTGHDGSISTAHANSPRDLFARLEAMVCMGEVAVNTLTVRRQIASGIDMIIYCTRLPDGSRKVASVSEVLQGRDGEEDVCLKEIYRFEKRGVGEEGKIQGVFAATGYVPSFVAENLELSEDPTVRSLFQP
jgi:pilus assembly protein CpaF